MEEEESENFSFSKNNTKSVKFAIDKEPPNTGRQSYGTRDYENLSESESADADHSFYGFRPVRHDAPAVFPLDHHSNSSRTPIYLSKNNEHSR